MAQLQAIYGNVVIVHHGEGVTTSYNHLSEISVSVGDVVEKGDRLGAVGSTGQSTGPHLHWGLVVAGIPVNPDEWLTDGFMEP
jgi:lysostaphin